MADGSTKKIGDIQPGDTVLATDPQTDTTLGQPVTAKIVTPDDAEFTELTISNTTTTTDTPLVSTSHHPYWDETTQRWTPAKDIAVGDQLLTTSGTTVTALSTRTYSTNPQEAHNLTVANLHTYY